MENQLIEFHKAFNAAIGTVAIPPTKELIELRRSLIEEEIKETLDALDKVSNSSSLENYVELLDGLCDSVYVLIGTAVALGLPFTQAFNEVHRSNMSKQTNTGEVIYRIDGKVLKPETWTPPNIWEIVYEKYVQDRNVLYEKNDVPLPLEKRSVG